MPGTLNLDSDCMTSDRGRWQLHSQTARLKLPGCMWKCVYLPGGQVMSLRRAVELALDAARGLAYMHNRKPAPIVHRDLKPANLMISGAISVVRVHLPPMAALLLLLPWRRQICTDFGAATAYCLFWFHCDAALAS